MLEAEAERIENEPNYEPNFDDGDFGWNDDHSEDAVTALNEMDSEEEIEDESA